MGEVVGADVGRAVHSVHGPLPHLKPSGQPHFFVEQAVSAQKQVPTEASHAALSVAEQPNLKLGAAVGSDVGFSVGAAVHVPH